ncbi:MAG: isoprenylcysteine carboxylmethyltransferase family protein [Candidatus Aminicenantes bacterium]|nr:isoprenylcysteine carboxylmethyltransferase family protein [Candidatus Aminicenantes bacterium]
MDKPHLKQTIYRWRVRTGFLASLITLIAAHPDFLSLIYGFIVALIGLALRTWACINLKKEKELTTSGPYRYTRNPLYLGNLIIGIGIVIASRSWWVLALFFVYFLVFYPIAIDVEKKRMAEFFPDGYSEYSQKVPLFIPTLKPKLPAGEKRASRQLYRKNREYRALMGTTIYWIVLLVKLLIFF